MSCLTTNIAGDSHSKVRRRMPLHNTFHVLLGVIALVSLLALSIAPEENATLSSSTGPSAFARELYQYGCGPVSVYISARRLGATTTLRELLERGWGDEPRHLSLKELCALVHTVPGLRAEGVRLAPEDLSEVAARDDMAAILVIRQDGAAEPNHTLVLELCDDEGITVLDYPVIRYRIPIATFVDVFDGHVILVKKTEQSGFFSCRSD